MRTLIDELWDLPSFEHADLIRRYADAPWLALQDLAEYLRRLYKRHPKTNKARIHRTAVIEGEVILSADCRVGAYAVIKGPTFIGEGCLIGEHSLVRQSLLGANSTVGHGSEIARSILLPYSTASHVNIVLDSIIGQRANLGGLFTTANTRIDGQSPKIRTSAGGAKISAQVDRMGALVGDNTQVGVMVVSMPGTIIGKDSQVYPNMQLHGYYAPGSKIMGRQQMASIP